MLEGRVVQGGRGIKGRKNWDNCNSIMNKIYLKIKVRYYLLLTYWASLRCCDSTI